MFEVLVFVYENYWQGDSCPESAQLERKLSAHGFDDEEISEALQWLDGLSHATQGIQIDRVANDSHTATVTLHNDVVDNTVAQSPDSLRIYAVAEQDHLGADCLGFIRFLELADALPPRMREIAIDRAMAAPGDPVALDEFKIIVLMVYWSTGIEPDALVLDELCDQDARRVAH